MPKKDINRYRNENVLIKCKCGCNKEFRKYDKYGRERRYILPGHRIVSIEERNKRAELMKGDLNPAKRIEVREKISRNRSGIPMSKEQLERIRTMNIGRKHTEEQKRKISMSEKGRKFPKEVIEKRAGKNHYRWLGGKSFEPYTADFNIIFKNKIRKRDNQICMNCGIHRERLNKSFDIHHIDYNKLLTIPENCISLCHKCHSLTNINREYWQKLFQQKLSKLYEYKYNEYKEIILEIKNGI